MDNNNYSFMDNNNYSFMDNNNYSFMDNNNYSFMDNNNYSFCQAQKKIDKYVYSVVNKKKYMKKNHHNKI